MVDSCTHSVHVPPVQLHSGTSVQSMHLEVCATPGAVAVDMDMMKESWDAPGAPVSESAPGPSPSLLGSRGPAAEEEAPATPIKRQDLEDIDVESPPVLNDDDNDHSGGSGMKEVEFDEDSPMVPARSGELSELAKAGHAEAGLELPWRRILLKVLASITCFLFLTMLLEIEADDLVTAVSQSFMRHAGLKALFVFVLLADSLPQPFTYIPLIFMAVKGSVPKSVVFLVCALGSFTAAVFGYGVGRCLRGPSWAKERFDKWQAQYPYVPEMMERRGALGVLIAAALPVPLAMATWTAGFFGVRFPCFLLAALGRCPKIAIFVLLSPGPAAL